MCKLTILTRTSYRPVSFNNLLASINGEADIIVSYDNHEAVAYIPPGIKKFYIEKNSEEFGYNKYVNSLIATVNEGWMIVVDDDDTIIPGSLKKLKQVLIGTNPYALLIQFMRGTYLKPHPSIFSERIIKMGHIGFPSLVLHSDFKNVAQVGAGEYADYYFIRDVIERAPVSWLRNCPVVSSPARGRGVMEK